MKTIPIIILFLSLGCASKETRRERLQADFPECFVTYELDIICESPFDEEKKGKAK